MLIKIENGQFLLDLKNTLHGLFHAQNNSILIILRNMDLDDSKNSMICLNYFIMYFYNFYQ
jgi:hypothetical protein